MNFEDPCARAGLSRLFVPGAQPLHDQYLALQYGEEVSVDLSLVYEDFPGVSGTPGADTA
ncbi:hypothetical protein GCM10027405_32440 [Arthrobacter alkaliphilus]